MFKTVVLSTAAALTLGLSATASFAGDAAKGESDFRRCRSCHAITAPDGTVIQRGGRVGPNLYGLPGRAVAGATGFRYSADLAAYGATGVTWNEELFTAYVANPTAFLREHSGDANARSPMSFRLRSGAADVWAYLVSVSPAAN